MRSVSSHEPDHPGRRRTAADHPPLEELAERDLLALMLSRGTSLRDPWLAAGNLLDRFGALAAVVAADAPELARTPGLDGDAVANLKLLRQICVQLVRSEVGARPLISSWKALLAYVRVALAHEPREQFRVLFLDKRNGLLLDEFVAHGTVDHAPVYNAGPGRVARLGRVPDIAETRDYVATVVDCYLALSAGRRLTSSRQCASRETGR
ncbi:MULTISPECIES: JAB domain-containing protein [unclassified Brevundimonas]|uniref:JAB domain-containing protein n=1 Tax=unclassified Brevundimonas TaxID=2622653 RepID=UPI000CFB38CA|nr:MULTISPECIES: JAB domain-containing protein [unclassified Brevundimonas]PRA27390.1 hypothetical protein CQ024_11435 [Brevundimonas sp. MYb27]PQZ84542.1 hypothetical protein CQ026_01735 [Brevundimonas sp. MYb31]PRB17777.1 hypothetical protein CQ039_01735 [Brevundimonas sp. MYb52]PRB38148.1 hypothetical protein CQ035_01735 [Brevundimonas sp. MYb46]PRB56070.1 hypothetical protein CQ028_01195 [Brevundimonas sp. MYb33]